MKLKEQITGLLDQFAQEELGNRLSQFAMASLRGMVLNVVDQHLLELERQKAEKKQAKEEKKDNG